jgi:hypothetical protein
MEADEPRAERKKPPLRTAEADSNSVDHISPGFYFVEKV